jgi:4-hydroxy-tetrahydrodipicolinate synthase
MNLSANDLNGVIPPVVTPFTADGDLDAKAFRAEVEYVATFPVGGVLVGAATGEGFTLEAEETATLCRIAKEVVGERLPVIAGAVEASTRKAIAKARVSAAAGADAIMVTPVTYLPDSDASAMAHFTAVAAEATVPLMVYNSMAHNRMSPETVIELARMPEVIGVKLGYGASSLHDLRLVLEEAGGQASIMWSQDQLLLPGYCLGARGSLSTVDSILPGHTTQMFEAVQNGDMELARKLDKVVSAFAGILGPDDLPSAVKTAINLQGREVGLPRAPFVPIVGERLRRIRELVETSGLHTERQHGRA